MMFELWENINHHCILHLMLEGYRVFGLYLTWYCWVLWLEDINLFMCWEFFMMNTSSWKKWPFAPLSKRNLECTNWQGEGLQNVHWLSAFILISAYTTAIRDSQAFDAIGLAITCCPIACHTWQGTGAVHVIFIWAFPTLHPCVQL